MISKSSIFYFILELAIFVVIVIAVSMIWSLAYDSYVFIFLIFSFVWVYTYKRTSMMLHYYSHLIYVGVYFAIVSTLISLVLKHNSVFLVSSTSTLIWIVVVSLIRYIMLKINITTYKVLVHPDLLIKLPYAKKIKLVGILRPEPSDISKFDTIVISNDYDYNDEWKDLIIHAMKFDISVLDCDNYEEIVEHRLSLEQLNENWMAMAFSIPAGYVFFRNILEFVLSLIVLPFLLVIFAIVGLIILVTMGRPIFFTQTRVGKNNKLFNIYKFRSMATNYESDSAQSDDLRVTSFGKFIRRFRIDELPQFINILKGEMSLIGPRPEKKEFSESFEKNIRLYKLRHMVRPGITGWAQVCQGYTNDDSEIINVKLQYDLYYIKHFSLIMDVKVLLKTIQTVLTGFGSK